MSHLQYVDDTLLVVETSLEIYGVIRLFLEVLRLILVRVNFFKSGLMSANVDHVFLSLAGHFLHCEVSFLLFKYLGLPVGVIPRLESTWEPLVFLMEKKLNLWKHKYVSLRVELSFLIQCLILFIFSSSPF